MARPVASTEFAALLTPVSDESTNKIRMPSPAPNARSASIKYVPVALTDIVAIVTNVPLPTLVSGIVTRLVIMFILLFNELKHI